MHIDKDLVAASATPLVLGILADGESYGYAIAKQVADLSGGHMEWTDGMLYPLLHRLERHGLVEASWGRSESGRRRKHYAITDDGRAALATRQEQWEVVHAALTRAWESVADAARPVRDAALDGGRISGAATAGGLA